MSIDEKKGDAIYHLDQAGNEFAEEKGKTDLVDGEVSRVIAAQKLQSYHDVWRTHKKGLLWSIGVSWVGSYRRHRESSCLKE